MGVLQLENETERKHGLKRIKAHTGKELNAAINAATNKFGLDFWMLLHGIDAYMERRKRRDKRKHRRKRRDKRKHRFENTIAMLDFDEMWGHS